MDRSSIGFIGNEYGGISVKAEGGNFWWSIRDRYDCDYWEEIPESLYDELIKFDDDANHTQENE